jgi:ureidoglycolate lyase
MKLMRVGRKGAEKPAMLAVDGSIRDLSHIANDIAGEALTPAGLRRIASVDPMTQPLYEGDPRIGACVGRVGKFICIGLNYADHAAETGAPVPKEPIVFMKATSAICGPNDGIVIPKASQKTDWEVELAVVIGSEARYVAANEALNYVAGYCIANDVSEREWQIERGGAWDKGKGADTFGPIGPWLVTKDEIPDPQNLKMWLTVDGVKRQDGSTKTMIFDVAQLVSYVSHFMSLQPGDIISTGTPPGVGSGIKPTPVFLKPGQTVRLGIEGLGEQTQAVTAYSGH